MIVAAFVLSIAALLVSAASAYYAHAAHRRDADRRHDERRPIVTSQWNRHGHPVITLSSFERLTRAVVIPPECIWILEDGSMLAGGMAHDGDWIVGDPWTLPRLSYTGPAEPDRISLQLVCAAGDESEPWLVPVELPPRPPSDVEAED